MLFMGGLFIVLLFVLTGIEGKAFPFLSTGKPLGFPGLVPALFFFAAISGFSYRNALTADSRNIELYTGFFFFMKTKTCIPVENCEGLYLQSSGKGKMTLYVKTSDSQYNTFIGGRIERITELAEKIASAAGLNKPMVQERDKNTPFRGKIKIFMMNRGTGTKGETKTETGTD